jgi:predicted MFS family arabinose efflux permease
MNSFPLSLHRVPCQGKSVIGQAKSGFFERMCQVASTGIITQYINWRWIFFINVPISIIVLLAAPFFIPKLEGTGKLLLKKFDILGTLLLTSGLITLVFGLTKVPSYGWGNKDVVEALIIAMLLLIVFVFNELKVSEPLLNIGLLTKGNIAAVSVISLFVVGCNGAVFYFLSYYNQEVLQYSPFIAALTLLPVVLLALVALQPVRKLLDKFGFKPVIIGQLFILAIGLFSLVRLPVSGHYLSDELPSLILIGLGITASIGLTIAATSGVKKEESGAISGVLNTAQQVGGPLILGILSTIAATHTAVSSTANTTVHDVHAAFVASAIFVFIAAMLCGVFVKGQSVTQKG